MAAVVGVVAGIGLLWLWLKGHLLGRIAAFIVAFYLTDWWFNSHFPDGPDGIVVGFTPKLCAEFVVVFVAALILSGIPIYARRAALLANRGRLTLASHDGPR